VKGRRLTDNLSDAHDFSWDMVKPGDYFKKSTGGWFVMSPSGESGRVVEPTWTITEHEDKTITVHPSIWFNSPHGWHGFLERGVWRQV
jgi:hypothetical protein